MTTQTAPTTQSRIAILTPMLRTTTSVVWFVLIAATLLSWVLGTDHGAVDSNTANSVLIILIAMVKVRFVGLYFMELRDAPTALRTVFEVYCFAVCGLITVMYLVGN